MSKETNETPKETAVRTVTEKFASDFANSNEDKAAVIIVREGQAEKIEVKNKVRLKGTIVAPATFFNNRVLDKELHDQNKCHVIFNKNAQFIKLVIDENFSERNYEITGKIESNPDLDAFLINTGETRGVKECMNFLKMNRLFFSDKELNAKIVTSLQNFKGKVEKEFENINDLRGNEKVSKMQKLETGLDASFELTIPIFKGGENKTFKVEILCHIDDVGVNIYFESRDLKELEMASINKMIDDQLENFKTIVCIEE